MSQDTIKPEMLASAQLFFNAMLDRTRLAQALGQTAYQGHRDYNTVLGYPRELSFKHYLSRYERQDIAGRIVDLPPHDTWKKPPKVSENDNIKTAFVLTWESLVKRLRVWSHLSRIDRISGIGTYGILLMGLKDGKKMSEEAVKGSLKDPKDILFLKPLSEGALTISTRETTEQSERFDFPLTYGVQFDGGKGTKKVHWTRTIHVADGKIDSEIFGTPRLRQVFNRLDDLIKYVGGGAEASWLNMRPGTIITTQPDYQLDNTAEGQTSRQNEIEEYLMGMARIMMMEGIDVKQLTGQMMDPKGGFDVEIALISAASGIPQRVLLGSAQGELAAAQEDSKQWAGTVAERQANYAEPEILRPFIDRLIWLGALPSPARGPDAYDIGELDEEGVRRWPTLFELTEEELSSVSLKRAQALAALWDPVAGRYIVPDEVLAELIGVPIRGEEIEAEPETLEQMTLHQARIIASNQRNGSIDEEQYRLFLIDEQDRIRRERIADRN